METVQQSHRRQKVCCAPVSQQSVPDTPVGLITTISVGIIPPARVVAEDLTKANLREGSPNTLLMALSHVDKQVTSESTDSRSESGLGGAKNNQQSSSKQEHLSCTQVDLAPVVVQQVAAVQIPMSRDSSSIWLCTPLMKMSLLMTHTRLYLLRMPLLFLPRTKS